MPGFTPNEGEAMIASLAINNVSTDRGTNLELMLFTNSTGVDETITEAALNEPSGTGYARITLTDGSWTGSADSRSYAQQTFTAGGDWTGDVYGYAIVTTGSTPRILSIEIDGNGPYTITENDTYKVTPTITFA